MIPKPIYPKPLDFCLKKGEEMEYDNLIKKYGKNIRIITKYDKKRKKYMRYIERAE